MSNDVASPEAVRMAARYLEVLAEDREVDWKRPDGPTHADYAHAEHTVFGNGDDGSPRAEEPALCLEADTIITAALREAFPLQNTAPGVR